MRKPGGSLGRVGRGKGFVGNAGNGWPRATDRGYVGTVGLRRDVYGYRMGSRASRKANARRTRYGASEGVSSSAAFSAASSFRMILNTASASALLK